MNKTSPLAFPHEHNAVSPGMTLRDYFAAQALGGIMDLIGRDLHSTFPKTGAEGIAATAYEIADAMLKVRTHD